MENFPSERSIEGLELVGVLLKTSGQAAKISIKWKENVPFMLSSNEEAKWQSMKLEAENSYITVSYFRLY